MGDWIANYVKGCARCQQAKNITRRRKTPLYRIPTTPTMKPFQTVALDLITQLPKSNGYDAILTIVDHGCTRAALFLPCSTNITGEGIARLYMDNVYRWFGMPSKVISDRDPRFTSHFARALTKAVGADQNLSTAFHPQTDGLSERKNQWVEQYLRLVASAAQDDWDRWLTIATAVHNSHVNATTKTPPIEALLGYRPRLEIHQTSPSSNQTANDRLETIRQKQEQARAAINRLAKQTPPSQFRADDLVWLEAKNLALPYQTPKLAPKRHGPFQVLKQISPVAYQLLLPNSWKIHDVFHAGLLTRYQETSQHGPNFTYPPPDLIDGEPEYEVESIRGHRRFGRNQTLQYLIKWKGYPESDNTWESSTQVFAPDLVSDYHQAHPLSPPLYKGKVKRRRVVIRHTLTSLPTSDVFYQCLE